MSLWGWGKYCTLIDRITRGREKIDLAPKSLPRPCPVFLFKAWPERSEHGNAGKKHSFPAKCAGKFGIETCPRVQWSWIVKYGWEKWQSGGFSGCKPPPCGQRSKSNCVAFTLSFEMSNSHGKASLNSRNRLKLQRTHRMWASFIDLPVKCSYFEIFTVVNRLYLFLHSIPYNVFKFSTVPLVTQHRILQRVTLSWIDRWLFLETWAWAACGLAGSKVLKRN